MNKDFEHVTINQLNMSLTDIEADSWHRLVNGSVRSKDEFHTGVVASILNNEPIQRTVVLRKTLPVSKELWFHTDKRSAKVDMMLANSSVHWLFYDKQARIQLRLKARATVYTEGELFEKQWANTHLMSRKCYQTEIKPGSISPIASDGLDYLQHLPLTPEKSEFGKAHFAVVCTHVYEMEWLFLNHSGHRKALFIYTENGELSDQHWLIP